MDRRILKQKHGLENGNIHSVLYGVAWFDEQLYDYSGHHGANLFHGNGISQEMSGHSNLMLTPARRPSATYGNKGAAPLYDGHLINARPQAASKRLFEILFIEKTAQGVP